MGEMRKKKKILIVDDERAILRILSIKLRVSGYDVITALGGQEALTLISSGSPDVVLLDIVMPDIDGFEVLRQVRTVSELPVIVFSARPEIGQKALNSGANDFIAKPFDVDYLVQRVARLVNNRNSRPSRL